MEMKTIAVISRWSDIF